MLSRPCLAWTGDRGNAQANCRRVAAAHYCAAAPLDRTCKLSLHRARALQSPISLEPSSKMVKLRHIRRLDVTDRPPFDVAVEGCTNTEVSSFAFPSPKVPHVLTSRSTTWKSARFRVASYCLAAQRLSRPLPPGIRFLHDPLPAPPTTFLTVYLPRGRRYGLTMFRVYDTRGLGPAFLPTIMDVRVSLSATGIADRVPFGPSLSAPLACLPLTTFISSLLTLTMPRSLAPHPS
jgi:hypothetical protein